MPFTANKKGDFFATLIFALGYGLVFYVTQLFLYNIGATKFLPDATTLARWDAPIYFNVAQHGYTKSLSNAGVFALFPFIWSLLHVGFAGMAIANFIIFAIAFSFICTIHKISLSEKLLWLTTPSLYFMMAPYSEALFSLLAAISFYGISTKKMPLVWVSLFLICLCRATATFLLPSLLVMELLSNDRKDILKSLGRYFVHYALPVLSGTACFVVIQYLYTGRWFIYYQIQVQDLGHKFSIPALPFSDFYGGAKCYG